MTLTYHQKYYRKNADKIRVRARVYTKHSRERRRAQVIEALGGVCTHCGFADIRALQIDHIHGGGSQEHRNGYGWYKDILASIEKRDGKFQLLCANCNWIKKHEQKEVPLGSTPTIISET